MSYVEVEIRAKTVELAVEAAMQELGVESKEQLAVEVLQEAEKGFLGIGGQDAVVRVKRRPHEKKGQERRRDRKKSGDTGKKRDRGGQGQQKGRRSARNGGDRQKQQSKGKGRDMNRQDKKDKQKADDRPALSLEEQSKIADDFLEGLLDAYGLDGSVETEIDDEVLIANVKGEQTEALVGVRGSVRSAIHELTRTVLQRYSQDTARLRLDIAGYAEKRRQALMIYAEQLIEQLRSEGGEIMLEPMSSADRKVIHDAAAATDGVSSYSEGEAPRRYVVLTLDEESAEEE